jgi:ribosomal protein S18 acetylase RimI-like enzyme
LSAWRNPFPELMEVTIRPAVAADIPAVLSPWAGCAAGAPTDTSPALERLLRGQSGALLLAFDGDRIVGTVIAAWDGWRGNIYRLVVAPGHRRRGIGRRLVLEAGRTFSAAGVVRVSLFVLSDDQDSGRFWASLRDLGLEADPYPKTRYIWHPALPPSGSSSDHLSRNRKQLDRLRSVVEGLDPEDLRQDAGDGWTVSAWLAHLAFWDRWTMTRWERYATDGAFDDIPGPVLDFVNSAALPSWLAVPGGGAAEMALAAASEVVGRIESLPPEAVAAAQITGRPAMVDRTLHWSGYTHQIERALRGSTPRYA